MTAFADRARQVIGLSPKGGGVLVLADVLSEEGRQIHGTDWHPRPRPGETEALPPIYREMHRLEQAGLCLSGGGIRSASFALGVMQALAAAPGGGRSRLIQQFHYLSTVSGGGYIGSWFTAWLAREHERGGPSPVSAVLDRLSRRGPDVEPIQITNLRENSSYITPHSGLMSGDMWAAVATIVRNFLINWLVVLPLLFSVVLFAKLICWFVFEASRAQGFADPIVAIAAVVLVTATSYRVANRPSAGISNRSAQQFYKWHAPLAVLSSLLWALVVAQQSVVLPTNWGVVTGEYAAVGAILYLLSWLLGRFVLWRTRDPAFGPPQKRSWKATDWFWWSVSGAIFGALLAVVRHVYADLPSTWQLQALVIAGPPVVMLAQMIAEMCFIGLISLTQPDDDDREWLARAGGAYAALAFGGAALFALVILAPLALELGYVKLVAWFASVGGIWGAIAAVLGASRLTASSQSNNQSQKGTKALSLDAIVKLSAPVFAAVLIMAASILLDRLLFHHWFNETVLFGGKAAGDAVFGLRLWLALCGGLAATLVLLAFIPWRVNVNRFSIHSFYRNRLIRAFLAASRTGEKEELHRPERNLFTDIDPDDNRPMHTLWDKTALPRGEAWRPLHIVNMALNIVSARKLAWQERKAEPFTVSPLHAGSGCPTFEGCGAFQPTENYGGKRGFGLSLGTAMAISGAAASPNMGYHSSPSVTFMMALFNVRLGWWLPNPGKTGDGRYATDGPRWALGPYVAEMFGLTQDNRKYVYLSDGGHFENLGLYEMVRRRCRYIVVSDASQDQDFKFGSLGDAVRKIGIDFGIRIEMIGLDALKKRSEERQTPGEKGPYHAMGLIHYSDVDGDGVEDGVLLYIKPGLHWTELAGVQNYASTHKTFPHESTGNQWFTELQFESYRRLGVEITWQILERAVSDRASYGREVTLADVMEDLKARAVSRGRRR